MAGKSKIDWCDATCNFVIGCKRGCKYCYAQRMNRRLRFVKKWNEPEFKPNAEKALKCKKPKAIFMNSMSDVCFWEEDELKKVVDAMIRNPQHNYIFLTKHTSLNNLVFALTDMCEVQSDFETCLENVFLGLTITCQDDLQMIKTLKENNCEFRFDFLSIEPLHGAIELVDWDSLCLVIIGAETGYRKDKIIPKKEWVDSIVKQCDAARIRVFMKENLRKIMGDDFRQDELVWAVRNVKN